MYRVLLILFLLCFLPACSSLKIEAGNASPQLPQQPVMSPLESFVSQAKPGDETFILNTKHGDVHVTVQNEYYSAMAKICRAVELRHQDGCVTELSFCREGDGNWKELAPLLDKCQ